jgi:hypothetical protein
MISATDVIIKFEAMQNLAFLKSTFWMAMKILGVMAVSQAKNF